LLQPLVDRREIAAAQRQLARSFREGATPHKARITFRPKAIDTEVYWHPDLEVWGSINVRSVWPTQRVPRYWNAFGVEDPGAVRSLDITCEANPAHEGYDKRVARLFARDDNAKIYLLHSGRIGGGRKGIGPALFWKYWRSVGGPTDWVLDGNTKKEYAIVAELGAPSAASQIATFVGHVADMKSIPRRRAGKPKSAGLKPSFRDESEEPRVYVRTGRVETKADHAVVVKALRRALETRNLRCGSDEKRDAYVLSSTGQLLALFEVKTTSETQPMYTGVGQLMMNGRATQPGCKVALILPDGEPRRDFLRQLEQLEILLVKYSWQHGEVVFVDLNDVLRDLPRSANRGK